MCRFSEQMVGHKLGEFAPTAFRGHSKSDKSGEIENMAANTEVKAIARYIRMSPFKVRRVRSNRGRSYEKH